MKIDFCYFHTWCRSDGPSLSSNDFEIRTGRWYIKLINGCFSEEMYVDVDDLE